jgi:sugar lactone lactonase YvrE
MELRRALLASTSLALAACADQGVVDPIAARDAAARVSAAVAAAFPAFMPLNDGFGPEGIEAGRGTTLFVGSIPGGAIVRLDARIGAQDTIVASNPARQASGLEYDQRTDRLFVAGGMTGQAYVYDASSGATVATYQLSVPDFMNGSPSLINDAVLTKDAVYFTDSFRPVLYRIPLAPNGALAGPAQTIPLTGDYAFVPLNPDNSLALNGNGIEATPDGKTLLVVNSTTGKLYRVDPATGVTTEIPVAGDQFALAGGDGLLLDGRDLYVVQGFINRIAVVRLSPDLAGGTVTRYIGSAAFDFPATIAELGGSLYAVNANFDEAPPPAPNPAAKFSVVRVSK